MTEKSENKGPSLEQCIQKYIAVEEQLKILQEKSKPLREWKTKLTNYIAKRLEEREQDVVKLTETDELRLSEKREYSSLSFSYIEKCLSELIPDESQVEYVMDYLRDNRDVKISPELKKFSIKPK